MANMTEKELNAISDMLTSEQILIKKYSLYVSMCTDPQIKAKCEQITAKHKNHFETLIKLLDK